MKAKNRASRRPDDGDPKSPRGGGEGSCGPVDNSGKVPERKPGATLRLKPGQIPIGIPPAHYPILKPARFKALYGGRGSAKSWTFGRYTAAQVWAGRRCLVVREFQRSIADSAKQLVEDQIKLCGLSGFEATRTEIRHENGGRFAFIGLQDFRAEGVKSYEGFDLLWVMEAQSLSALSLEALTPTFRKEGSELLFEWNPISPSDPVDNFFRGPDGPPPDSIVIEVNHDQNPYFPEALRAEMENAYERDPVRAAHVWGGKYREGAGGYFAGVLDRSRHVLEPFEIPARWKVDRAHDWGSSSPHATIWFAEADGEEVEIEPGISYAFPAGTLFVIAEDYGTSGDTARGWNTGTKETAADIATRIRNIDKQLEARFRGVRVQPGPADNQIFDATPGHRTIAQDYAAGGVRFHKADKKPGTRISGAVKIRDRLSASRRFVTDGILEEPGLFFFEGCPHTVRSLGAVQIDEKKPDAYATDGEDHLPDALRYRVLDRDRATKVKELAL